MITDSIDLSIINAIGRDTFKFLQGQLTCDMKEVTDKLHPGAICNHQGRVIASFEIQKNNEYSDELPSYNIILPASLSERVLKILEKYAQFSETQLTIIPTKMNLNLLSHIQNKTAVILPETSEKFTPHELNYHHLNFVSFNKGCYKGQEIIARMHYLGKLKKQLQHVILNSPDIKKLKENTSELQNMEAIINIAFNPPANHYDALVLFKL